jgi:hypothetical protein
MINDILFYLFLWQFLSVVFGSMLSVLVGFEKFRSFTFCPVVYVGDLVGWIIFLPLFVFDWVMEIKLIKK